MLAVQRTRTIAAPPQDVWDVVSDPHHLPRWWPRVTRAEDVESDAFTEVLAGRSGKIVRADFRVLVRDPPRRIVWTQLIDGTPFANVLQNAETEIALSEARAGAATEVAVELRQELQSMRLGSTLSLRTAGVARFGGRLVRRAAVATVEQALDGLARILGADD